MAVDVFLSLVHKGKPVLGETQDSAFAETAFELLDFSFGAENPTTIGSASGGAGAGKANFSEFTIKRRVDNASAVLFQNLAQGVHYEKGVLSVRKAGGGQASGKVFLTFNFGTVFTTKIEWSGPGDEGPKENITFVYGTLVVKYQPQQADRNLGPATVGSWNQITNSQIVP
jgi:type VI secretion system secreted protein Hcp